MGEVVPCGAVVAVVLADGPPGPLGQVRSPRPPGRIPRVGRRETAPLRTGRILTHAAYSPRSVFRPRKPPVHVTCTTHPAPPAMGQTGRHGRWYADLRLARGGNEPRVAGTRWIRRVCHGHRHRPAHPPLPRAAH